MPPPIAFERPIVRRSILLSYWIVILLAVPGWWYTTSIERLSLPNSRVQASARRKLRFPIEVSFEDAAEIINVQRIQQSLTNLAHEGLDIRVTDALHSNSSSTYRITTSSDDRQAVSDRTLRIPVAHYQEDHIQDTLITLLNPSIDSQKHIAAKFAPRYRLAFSLLNEDSSAGQAVTGWDVRQSVSKHIMPLLERVSVLHNFTIESQLRYHAPLAFQPEEIHLEGQSLAGLTSDHLTVFVNAAEWTLSSSVSNDPVLHFIVFIPSSRRRPLRIFDSTGLPTRSDSFVIPQWGGVVIHNPSNSEQPKLHLDSTDLTPIFTMFRSQLSSLLGVPPLPAGVTQKDQQSLISDWQLDALLRRRAREIVTAGESTLDSIIKLVDQIDNMPVGIDVRGDVKGALDRLDQVYASVSTSLDDALRHSNAALGYASRAFFNPGMLAMLYFPAEHTYAVYAPMFVPVMVPLIAAAVREFRGWQSERRLRAGAAPAQ